MTFEHFRSMNVKRCNEHFHPLDSWLPSQWSNAMAGEAGEICNLTKKLDRLKDPAITGQMNKEEDQSEMILFLKIADELADVVIYADLLAARLGIDLNFAIITKFNESSRKHEIRNNLPEFTLPRL